jgi:transcriptional regulator with XRE-family HTH domain
MIGPTLRSLREAEGLTQAELAGRLQLAGWDISRETLAKVESQVRCVTDRELVRFAEALEVEPNELLRPIKF